MFRSMFMEILQFFFVFYIQMVTASANLKCEPADLVNRDKVCPSFASCNSQTHICQCNKGYVWKHAVCVPDDSLNASSHMSPNSSSLVDTSGSGHVVAAVLVPMFLIVFVVLGVYFGRKHRMFTWIRNKLSQRNTNYDEFMIGQDPDDDDPPLR